MKLNLSALTLAASLLAVWGLRRLGIPEGVADAITSALLVGLGLSRPAVEPSLPAQPVPPPPLAIVPKDKP